MISVILYFLVLPFHALWHWRDYRAELHGPDRDANG